LDVSFIVIVVDVVNVIVSSTLPTGSAYLEHLYNVNVNVSQGLLLSQPGDNNGDKDGDEDNNSLTNTSLNSDVHDTREDRGGGSDNCHCCLPWAPVTAPLPPLLPVTAPLISSTSPALLPLPPPTTPPMSIAQFARTLIPSKTGMSRSTLQAISAAGTSAAQNTGPAVPWPYSAPLQPVIIDVVIVPVDRVHGHCHYSGKPV
jgi:hypothetical protein